MDRTAEQQLATDNAYYSRARDPQITLRQIYDGNPKRK